MVQGPGSRERRCRPVIRGFHPQRRRSRHPWLYLPELWCSSRAQTLSSFGYRVATPRCHCSRNRLRATDRRSARPERRFYKCRKRLYFFLPCNAPFELMNVQYVLRLDCDLIDDFVGAACNFYRFSYERLFLVLGVGRAFESYNPVLTDDLDVMSVSRKRFVGHDGLADVRR